MKITVIGSAIIASIYSILVLFLFSPKPSKNLLALGPNSPVQSEITLPIFQPVDLSPMSSSEIINLRRSIIAKQPELLAREYTPTGLVFSRLEDRLPWLSVKGFYYLGHTSEAIIGPSNEARHLLNPYLLVSAEFLGYSAFFGGQIKWAKNRITDQDLSRPDFPFYCRPQKLVWNPRLQKAEVTYPITSHVEAMQKWVEQPINTKAIDFALVGYNARDFGFTHLAIDQKTSSGIANPDGTRQPVKLTSHLAAVDGACAPKMRCNTIYGISEFLDYIIVDKLPARIVVKLWRGEPQSADDPVNMRFDILLQ